MVAYVNIPKRRTTTARSATLDAIRVSSLDWKLDDAEDALASMRAKRELRELLAMTNTELRDNAHASFSDLESMGLFGWLRVLERRGFWRIEAHLG